MRKTSMWFIVMLGLSQLKLSLISAQDRDKVNGQHLVLRETDLYITWELLNPTGDVAGYKVMWQDREEEYEIFRPFLNEEILLKNSTAMPCSEEFNLTIIPYDVDFEPIGSEETRIYTWQDVIMNISLRNGKSTIHASWSVTCPSNTIEKFFVAWRSEERGYERACVYPQTAVNTSTPLECFGDPPRQCSNYHVRIQPVDSSGGDFGVPAENSMHTQLETFHSVLELQPLALDSDSVTLTWRKPRPQCPATGYIVSYSGNALWGERKRHEGSVRVVEARNSKKNSPNNGLEVELVHKNTHNNSVEVELFHYGIDTTAGVIRNLMPYSIYDICVSDTTKDINTRSCNKIQTKEIKPDAPVLLSVDEVNQTSLKLTWNSPEMIKGVLKGFIIRWSKEDGDMGRAVVSEESYTIIGLEPCEKYIITLTASTGAGEGEPIRKSGATDDGCIPSGTLITIWILLALPLIALLAFVWTRRRKLFLQRNKNSLPKSATEISMLPGMHFSGLANAENDEMSDGVDVDESQVREPNGTSGEPKTINSERIENKLEKNTHDRQNVQDHHIGSETDMVGGSHFRKYTLRADPTKVFLLHTGLERDGVDDFLSVIWKQNVKIIVMLESCIQYWPASATSEANWASFAVQAQEETIPFKNYTYRIVTLKKGDESKSVKQFHLNDYSGIGVPTSKKVISEMVSTVHQALDPGPCNVVVQISSREDLMHSFIGLLDVMMEEKKAPWRISIRSSPLLRRKISSIS